MNKKLAVIGLLVIPILLVGCGKAVQPSPSDADKVKTYNSVRDIGTPEENAKHGLQTGFWYGALAGTGSTNANGVGFLRRYEDGFFEVTVNLNIKQAEQGNMHMAWLTDSARSRFVRVGVLESIIGDTRHSVATELKEDLSLLTTVVVSLEASTAPEKPGIVIEAEGSLREVVRPAK